MSKALWRRKSEDVVEAVRAADGQCVVLIGAGCSKSAGIPLAGGLIREIETRFPAAYERAKGKAHQNNYNKLMLELTTQQRRQLLQNHIEKAKINWAHLALAQMFKNGKVDRVLTVNFDPLLVRACALVGHYPAIYDLATASRFRSAAIAPNSVFYLNGQHTGFVILNTETELEAHRARLKEIVSDTGTRRTWIIAGYSGEADPLLEIIAEQSCFDGGLYWIGHSSDPSDELRKSLFEPFSGEQKDAFYVGGQDADRFFVALAQQLEVFPPAILADPFEHLRNLIADIDFSTGGDYEQSLEGKLLAKLDQCAKALGESKSDISLLDASENPEKWLLAGEEEKVLKWYLTLENPSDQDKGYAAWAYLGIGNDLHEKAEAIVARDLSEARRLWSQAGEKYQDALAIKADMHEALNNWGLVLASEADALRVQNLSEAARLWGLAGEKYQAALAIKADKHEALFNWGLALADEADALSEQDLSEARRLWSLAREKYQAALAIKADLHEALCNWGLALANEADALQKQDLLEARRLWSLARERYQAALVIKADLHEALFSWGLALANEADALRDQDLPEARRLWSLAGEKYQAALAIKADLHKALCNWGLALGKEGDALREQDLPEARRLWSLAGGKFQAALAIKADLHKALCDWGLVLGREGDALCEQDLPEARRLWSLAREKYQAALAIKADLHGALCNWGLVLAKEADALQEHDLSEARRLWSLAEEKYIGGLAIRPDDRDCLNNLSSCYLNQWHAESDSEAGDQLLEKSRSICQGLEKLSSGSGAYNLACSYAVVGNPERCLYWLNVADENGYLPDRKHLEKDRDLNQVRTDPSFEKWWAKRFLD